MSSNNNSSGGGMGFVGGLQLLFIGLKLGGVIKWSWWWVMSPFLCTFGLVGLLLLIAGVVAVTALWRAK